ncbi:hypothetical protein C0583_04600 [Candidatus Parcubacteria bacterium]|nr:MAG: hypothetical protein C0583_04600 [Candidatus Parcubacteria bacterium]
MILCDCGNKIEKAIAVAYAPGSTVTRSYRPRLIPNGLSFLCRDCCKNKLEWWDKHNHGRSEAYLAESADINVFATTQAEFARKALPQIINGFHGKYPGTLYISKSAIKKALIKAK